MLLKIYIQGPKFNFIRLIRFSIVFRAERSLSLRNDEHQVARGKRGGTVLSVLVILPSVLELPGVVGLCSTCDVLKCRLYQVVGSQHHID